MAEGFDDSDLSLNFEKYVNLEEPYFRAVKRKRDTEDFRRKKIENLALLKPNLNVEEMDMNTEECAPKKVHQLGEHFQNSKIGEVLTPAGTIKMSVSYRSKDDMTITPQKVEKGSSFTMKSDYFKPDMSPQNAPTGGIRIDKNLNCQKSPNDMRRVGAFAASGSLPDENTFPDLAIFEKPFLNLSRGRLLNPKVKQPESDKNANVNLANYARKEAGVDFNCNPNEKEEEKLMSSEGSSGSVDFLMKPPFADYGGDNDLGNFFRECQSAPPLASFSSQPTLEQQVMDISSQIAKYESSMTEYDNFVDSFTNMDVDK